MKEALRKLVEVLFPKAKVVADLFHVIADSNKRMDEARKKQLKFWITLSLTSNVVMMVKP